MRALYQKPVAIHIDYQYQEQVKAKSFTCDRVIFQAVTQPGVTDCREYRQYSPVSKYSNSDPCKESSRFQL